MKSIFIVSSYPSNEKKIRILKETLKSIRNIGFDILLTTNLPIKDSEIYELIDYLIYDKTDITNFYDYGIFLPDAGWYAKGPNFSLTVSFDNAYHFDLYRSTRSGLVLASGLGYEYFNYIEGDCIINNPQFILNLQNQLIEHNRKLFFVEVEMRESRKYMAFGTHCYGGFIDYFLENSNIPFKIDEWVKDPFLVGSGLEVVFHDRLNHLNILKLPPYNENDIYLNKLKKIDDHNLKHLLYFDNDDCYLYFLNTDIEPVQIHLYADNINYKNYYLAQNYYNIEKINVNEILNKKIRLELISNNEMDVTERYIDDRTINIMKKTQKIVFN